MSTTGTEQASAPAAPHDLRLVPPALTAWAVVVCGQSLGSGAAAVLGGAGVLIAVVSVVRGRSAVLVAVGVVAAAVAVVVGAQVWQVERHPVRGAAQRGAPATVVAHLTDVPRAVSAAGYGGRPPQPQWVVVPAELEAADVAGQQWRTSGRIVVLAPVPGWAGLLPGQRVRIDGWLSPAERSALTVAVLQVRAGPQVLTAPSTVQQLAERVRDGLRRASRALDAEPAGLLPALVVGDTSALVPTVQAEFRAAGLTHLTAVSGANVAIICGAVLGLARLARAGPRVSALLAGVALIAFVVICRASPSVLRAALMGAVALLALVLGRARSAVPALCAAVLMLLISDPALGVDAGFTLSVLATAALVLLAPGWAAALRTRGVPAGIAEALAVPTAAHAVTAPVVAGLSAQVSLVAVVANLLAAPAVAPATVLGALVALLGTWWPGAAATVAKLAGPAVSWLIGVGHRAAAIPGAVLRWPSGVWGALLLAVLILLIVVGLRARQLRAFAAAVLLGSLLVLVPTRLVTPGWPAANWVLVACDVGQGDALVVATADPTRAVLVDAGPDPGPVSSCLDRLGVRRLALVVISHLHADHIGGLAGALQGRMVNAVALGPGRSPGWAFTQVIRTAAAVGVPVVALTAGQRLAWPGLVLDVLAPLRDPPLLDDRQAQADGSAVNNTSVVLRATTPAGRLLLTGDVELDAQADLLATHSDLRADVLKVPHHGSSATATEFLAAIRPRVAIVSVGAHNRYGHPSRHVLHNLTRAGTRVLRTDLDGDVAVVGGSDLRVVSRGGAG
jgi:competence protein ComEC